MAIRRADRARLARLAGPRLREAHDAVEDRAKLRNKLCFFRRVALLLAVAEVEPESTCIARRLHEAEAALAAIPDTPELAKADEAYLACLDTRSIDDWQTPRYRPPPRVEEPIKSAIERLMTRYRTDLTDIDLATHSPFELFAWCLSRHGATYDEAADKARKAAEDLLLLAPNRRVAERPDAGRPRAHRFNRGAPMSSAFLAATPPSCRYNPRANFCC